MNYKSIDIPINAVSLKGRLRLVKDQKGLIIFSHGSGSSRLSSRNNYVADWLQNEGYSSLLFDLLTTSEDLIYENRFDIDLLTMRLVKATQWISKQNYTNSAPIGFFGASTGAASALNASTLLNSKIKAIVSRGGRPDMAESKLNKVDIPTLLIVGGNDGIVIELNKKAYNKLDGIKKLEIVEGATHLFSEPGKLDEVAKLTCNWFNKYLKK
ncbi:MAG: dienelactone hydrolase family protein [Algibacter sp.]|uniref:dienelactone hydrolase family protein n=1 Tax=Algibacter sp. TaxID=1872428 RepID=UPI00260CFDA3|nr:dienelactone hydrolase family protein [Algibacter sp.]MDG1729476.1 dienelactone hydrolase family protein [Algibacter sp.]MDG2178662.1 dienelactone hydrolase family protein [Algibacter sp.]